MTYNEALSYINSRRKFQKSSSHERIRALLSLLGNPQNGIDFIHVVGTNGKGTVCTCLSDILTSCGYKTGLFTSPYIVKFEERIRVNGEFISEDELCSITNEVKQKIEMIEKDGLFPTVFETILAIAMVHYKKQNCRIVVLEAGIGGGKDSTNVIENSLISVFTSISLDHTDVLGDTVEKIAEEKSGIIKKNGTVVCYGVSDNEIYPSQNAKALDVIKRKCTEMNASLTVPCAEKVRILKRNAYSTVFSYNTREFETKLWGKHQIGNLVVCVAVCDKLRENGYDIPENTLKQSIFNLQMPARTERIHTDPLVVIDGGHNEGAAKMLKESFEIYLKGKKITLVCSFMKDKDYVTALKIIAPMSDKIIFTVSDFVRGESTKELRNAASEYCKEIYECENGVSAIKKALTVTDKNDAIVVCGSFYLASEIRKFFM